MAAPAAAITNALPWPTLDLRPTADDLLLSSPMIAARREAWGDACAPFEDDQTNAAQPAGQGWVAIMRGLVLMEARRTIPAS